MIMVLMIDRLSPMLLELPLGVGRMRSSGKNFFSVSLSFFARGDIEEIRRLRGRLPSRSGQTREIPQTPSRR
jgi:hypothetical protein